MTFPAYVLDCPHCGFQLAHHIGPPQDAPWQCASCNRGWWTSELSPDARLAWRPLQLDHLGVDVATHLDVVQQREQELAEAFRRRTSARRDHLPFLRQAQLAALVNFLTPLAAVYPRAAVFLADVQQALQNVTA